MIDEILEAHNARIARLKQETPNAQHIRAENPCTVCGGACLSYTLPGDMISADLTLEYCGFWCSKCNRKHIGAREIAAPDDWL